MEPYFLISNTYIVGNKSHVGYGIGCCADNSAVEDISTDPIAIENLINLCNKLKLSPIHLEGRGRRLPCLCSIKFIKAFYCRSPSTVSGTCTVYLWYAAFYILPIFLSHS